MLEDKMYTQMRLDFQERFYNEIAPKLKILENDRLMQQVYIKKAWAIFIILGVIVFFLAKISPIVFGIFKFINIVPILFLFITLLLAGFSYSQLMKKVYEKRIKLRVMEVLCNAIGNIKWIPITNVDLMDYFTNPEGMKNALSQTKILDVDPDKLFIKSNLIPQYNIAIPDDVFKGCYNGVEYDIVEVCCLNDSFDKESITFLSSINSKYSSTPPVFSGVVIKFPMNKNFVGNTVITPETTLHQSPYKNLSRVIIEDVIFEKSFDVFSDNQVEARYLITTAFIERLNNIKLAFNSDKISCAFYDKYLLIALHTNQDLFSVGDITKPVNDIKPFSIMFEEVLSIIKLIDYFKLDKKIGL